MNPETLGAIHESLTCLTKLTHPSNYDSFDIDEFKTSWKNLQQYLIQQKVGIDTTQKKSRMIPMEERCMAKRANGGRCTRRRKTEHFCGTHSKMNDESMIDDTKEVGELRDMIITNIDIRGITYFTDQDKYLYMPSDILKSAPQPRIIGRYAINDEGDAYIVE